MNKPKQPAKTVTTSAQTSTPTIREGSRNGELTKLAGAMRRKGLEAPAIAAALQSHNQSHCLPPLPEKEVAAICRSIGRYPAEAPTDKMLCERFAWTDAGAGEMFAAVCGDKFRHVPGIGWLSYDGRRFNKKRGEKEARLAFVRCVARRLRDEALRVNHDLRESLEKYARRLEGSAKIDCALKEAACVAPIAAEVDDFDNDPWLFNCLNGVLNLKNDLFRDHTPEDNFMLVANVVYDPDAVCPLWDRFMDDTFQGDKEMIDLNYRWYGHCLTGDVTEQVLVIPYGEGGNGKNVQLDTTTGIMGDYGCEGAPDLLIATKGNKHTTEILDLLGKRLVVCSEPERDGELKMSLVKRLTGNKLLKGRAMHKDFVEFDRSHKMVLLRNNKPIVKEDSNAVWRRLRLVPYNYIVPEEKIDRQLTEKLVNEYSGILNRLVKGCLEWQRRGLAWPAEVMAATGSYRAEQNPFLGFVDESCVVGDGLAIPVCELHEHFRTWSRISGLSAEFFDINPRRFSQLVTDCGYVKKSARIHGGQVVKCWSGIGLRASDIEEDIIT